jgi:maltose alpha-D-glucosyltransferase/alpha-amylase
MTVAALPTLRVAHLDDALGADVLRRLTAEQLAAFLMQRRWFGGKGRAPASVEIGDVIELRGSTRAAVVRLDVNTGNGATAWYQLPLAVRRAGDGEGPSAVLALVEAADGNGVLFDAVEDDGFRTALGTAFGSGESLATPDGGSRWVIELVDGQEEAARQVARLPSRTVRAEQSNTSIIFGDLAIMKLFRRLERGLNPDVEIGRFLTAKTNFTHTPPLLGVVEYESADLQSIAGMLQGFLPGSVDAWQDALERSRAFFASSDEHAAHPWAVEARQLGRITRELHDALASSSEDPDFAPRIARRGDVERWAANARRRVEDAIALLGERVDAVDLPDGRGARAIVDECDSYLAHLDELVTFIGDDAGQLIRHHGDYHLGQVLRTADGDFQIIDFEGEPARPLAERRERSSALRDVAGMLRSFAYAAATLAAEQQSSGELGGRRASEWERGARDAFLDGYQGGGNCAFLPSTPRKVDAVRELFETEKVFYELSYELNNRPAWAWIPIAGISALRASPAGRR